MTRDAGQPGFHIAGHRFAIGEWVRPPRQAGPRRLRNRYTYSEKTLDLPVERETECCELLLYALLAFLDQQDIGIVKE